MTLPLILLLGSTHTYAQIVTIPDVTFKSTLVNNTAINTNGDTEIQVTEAQAFTGTIQCPPFFSPVYDATGIEAFTSLSVFNCGNQNLTSLDLSQNIALTELELYDNQITSLDFSQNTLLAKLGCEKNYITTLDLSTNTALTSIVFGGNQLLTSVNLKNGNNTNVTGFNATNNPNLNCIIVDSVAYSDANWINIDVGTIFSTSSSACSVLNSTFNVAEDKIVLKSYPNPTTKMILIALGKIYNNVSIEVSNTMGQLVYAREFTGTQYLELELEGVSGLYFVKVQTEDGEVIIKAVKE